jgi:uncharacterized protein YutD
MYQARKNVEIKGTKRDIIEEYANYGSTVYCVRNVKQQKKF